MRGTQFAQLTAFVAVAEHSSFTRAAKHLGISTPSLSQKIRSLEEQFGVRLLDRTTRSVALTEAGEQLLTHLTPVLEGVDKALDAVNAFRDKPAGKLRLTVHPFAAATVLAPITARFVAEYPEISLDICVDAARKDIVGERFDAGIHLGGCVDEDMIAVPIGGNSRVKTVASPDYLRRNPSLSVPDDLRQHNCITYCWAGGELGLPWRFKEANRQVQVPVKGSLSVNDVEFALRAGLDGIGIVQLPEAMVSSLVVDGRLATVLADWSPQGTEFILFYSSRRHVPVKLRVLVDFLRQESRQSVRASGTNQLVRTTSATDVAGRRPGELHNDVRLSNGGQETISTLQRDRIRRPNIESLSYRGDGAILKVAAASA